MTLYKFILILFWVPLLTTAEVKRESTKALEAIMNGENRKAIQIMEKVRSKRDLNVEEKGVLGVGYYNVGSYSLAFQHLTKHCTIKENDVACLFSAYSLVKLNREKTALDFSEKACDLKNAEGCKLYCDLTIKLKPSLASEAFIMNCLKHACKLGSQKACRTKELLKKK